MRDMMKPAILIIENDEDTRRLYADLLTYTDAKIVEAGNPYEAFEQLRRNPISLIVTDLHMVRLPESKTLLSRCTVDG